MYHSITFGEKNTWDDWHLIPSSRPVFSPPQPAVKLINIPGRSGSLDLTESFGPVVYADRQGSIEFYWDHETEPTQTDIDTRREFVNWESWIDAYTSVMKYLHGQKLKCVLEDDPDYYYEGRFIVSQWQSDKNFSTITVNYTVSPYKFSRYEYGNDWLWDPFDFENDVVSDLANLYLDPILGLTVPIVGSSYRSIPTIECTANGVQLYFDNYPTPIQLSKGENRPSLVVITEGAHVLRFVGRGYVTIHYRGGSL